MRMEAPDKFITYPNPMRASPPRMTECTVIRTHGGTRDGHHESDYKKRRITQSDEMNRDCKAAML